MLFLNVAYPTSVKLRNTKLSSFHFQIKEIYSFNEGYFMWTAKEVDFPPFLQKLLLCNVISIKHLNRSNLLSHVIFLQSSTENIGKYMSFISYTRAIRRKLEITNLINIEHVRTLHACEINIYLVWIITGYNIHINLFYC